MPEHLYENRISQFEKPIAEILAQLAHHVHPKVVEAIRERNIDERRYFEDLFGDSIESTSYLFSGSSCVFPGVRRYVSNRGKKQRFNPEFSAIIDDNIFPRHLWCFIAGDRIYSGPAWQNLGLANFELAHVFSHKESNDAHDIEERLFKNFRNETPPLGNFSCACNTILLPKGSVRPTDNSATIKAVFFKRYIELYGEDSLQGRSDFRHEDVPSWYQNLQWNEPLLPPNWKIRVNHLLEYRKKKITHIMRRDR